MKLKALITTLVLSTSTAALAKPSYFEPDRNDLDFHDRRMPARLTWVSLSQSVTAARRNVIQINEDNDNLRAIRLQNGSGATYVYSISLRFDDGSRKEITVDKWLYAGAPMLTFELEQGHEGLTRIMVKTWTSRPSTFEVLGQKQMRRPWQRPPILEPNPPQPIPPAPAPVALSIGTNLTFANSQGYVHIPVGTEKGRFHTLRIESIGAATYIGHVFVTFANGNQQVITLKKAMNRGEMLDLDLEGGSNAIVAVTLMADEDVRAVGPSASRFNVSLL